jgi:fibronectin type 3 domain-containing protein
MLGWSAVTDPSVTGYRVYWGTSSHTYVQSLGTGAAVGKVTSFTASGLKSGVLYYFAITSIDAAGNESAYSNEASSLIK